jgi:hypothetical protein
MGSGGRQRQWAEMRCGVEGLFDGLGLVLVDELG